MILVRTAIAECMMVGEDESGLPSPDEIAAHVERVESNACGHYAITVNGRIEMNSCPACAPA